ncbi:Uncharacterised protein [Pseudomonas fluorescens]|uniref:Uncharacterized protein n=1 Tax=Pseudomonas fluorescens TaxID=294 RepID=A0A448DXK1_PSEFL|nr:Uncharacterised protein [Pseudomonas fluorescens]
MGQPKNLWEPALLAIADCLCRKSWLTHRHRLQGKLPQGIGAVPWLCDLQKTFCEIRIALKL